MAAASTSCGDPPAAPTAASEANAWAASAVLDPRLVMAARRGNADRLGTLLLWRNVGEGQAAGTVEPTAGAAAAAETAPAAVIVQIGHQSAASSSSSSSGAAAAASPSLRLLDGVTRNEGDSLLHVVAASGDGRDFCRCASVICNSKRSLLYARNNRGDTPLHCAAGAGNTGMIRCLVDLAKAVGTPGNEAAVKGLLRMRNDHGETVLHQAIRSGNFSSTVEVNGLDNELARIPYEGGASPLYLAISLGEWKIAQYLLDATGGNLSYSGPDGRNVLHEAASSAYVLSTLLKWLSNMMTSNTQHVEQGRPPCVPISQLADQRDNKGNTPLHLAASLEESPLAGLIRNFHLRPGANSSITSLLLNASEWSVYQPDDKGRYPIHVAAMNGNLGVVMTLVQRCPDCTTLRDGQGRTFLHVAVESERFSVVKYVCQKPQLKSLLNVQDNEGNTALHLAVQVGNRTVFNRLIRNRAVLLGVPNNKGLRPLDLSRSKLPATFYYSLNPTALIETSLQMVGAPFGRNQLEPMSKEEMKARDGALSKALEGATQVMGIVSVLVATVTFASAFTLPGGYIQSKNDGVPGTPVLAGSYAFDAFIVADALAFICSCLATFSLVFAGVPGVDVPIRMEYMNMAYDFMRSSVRSMVAAFALGLYLVLAPVARKTAIAVCLMTCASFLHGNLEAMQVFSVTNTAIARWRTPIPAAWVRIAMSFFTDVLKPFWPLIVIFGLPAFPWRKVLLRVWPFMPLIIIFGLVPWHKVHAVWLALETYIRANC